MILRAFFVALITVGALIKVPIPVTPFTLQFLFTTLAGLLLGAREGFTAVSAYVLLGLLGVPVFAEGGGLGYVLRPSFGYLPGFAVGAFVTGAIAGRSENPGYKRLLAANFAGLGVVYALGMSYCYLISNFYLRTPLGVWPLVLYGFILAVPGDIVLCFAAAGVAKRLSLLLQGFMRMTGGQR